MIEFTAIETLIMAYSPLVATLVGIICAFCKMIKNILGGLLMAFFFFCLFVIGAIIEPLFYK